MSPTIKRKESQKSYLEITVLRSSNCLDTGADKDEILDVYAREYPWCILDRG